MPQNDPQFLPGQSLSLGVSCLLSMQPVSSAQPSVEQDTPGSAKGQTRQELTAITKAVLMFFFWNIITMWDEHKTKMGFPFLRFPYIRRLELGFLFFYILMNNFKFSRTRAAEKNLS